MYETQIELSLKEKRECARAKQNEEKAKILDMWINQWNMEQENRDLNFFLDLFVSVYEYTKYSMVDNKKKNEKYKKIYLLTLLGILVCMVFQGYRLFQSNITFPILIENGLYMVILLFLSGIVSKWIDIKKYQETWARHSLHIHKMDMEMLLFISKMAPYDDSQNKVLFAERILKIWDMNEDKFVHNMENKEKELLSIGLGDIILALKK